MLHGRRRLAGLIVGAGMLAVLPLLAGCAGTDQPRAATATRAWIAPDPLAGLTGQAVAVKTTDDAAAARSLVMNGTVSQSGASYVIDLGIKRGQGCTGTVGISGKGTLKLTVVGATVYLNPDKKFWTAVGGSNASAVIGLLDGRYIKVPPDDPSASSFTALCDISTVTGSAAQSGTVTREPLTALDGRRVIPLKASDGSTEYVTDTSAPQLFEAVEPKGAQGAGRVTFAFGAPVTVAAPPASQVIDGAQLGLGPGGPTLA
jgi:hypothetical protein